MRRDPELPPNASRAAPESVDVDDGTKTDGPGMMAGSAKGQTAWWHPAPGQRRKVIIDTDPGIDDAITILAALNCPDIEVVGITTLFGNCR